MKRDKKKEFLKKFGKAFLPEKARPKIRDYLQRAGIYQIPYVLFGGLFWLSSILTLIVFVLLWSKISTFATNALFMFITVFVGWFAIHLAIAFLIMALVYFYFDYKIYNRTKQIEKVLPDFLTVFSENLRTGMTTDKSLWRSVKPEFGVLASEIKIAAKQVLTGKDIENALDDFSTKYDSPTLNRSLKLIVEGMKSGSEIASIIDKVVEDIRKTNDLKKRMATNAFTFMIFITVIVIFIAPGLFALSQNLLMIIAKFVTNLQSAGVSATNLPIQFDTIAIEPADFETFSRASLIITSFFSSLIVAIISKGEMKAGLKYIPVFMIGSLLSHQLFISVLGALFGGMF
tara:strand:+ start:7347 stop:8381 length:1035 start_codon:yes stop_codon:yes gene_type:complete